MDWATQEPHFFFFLTHIKNSTGLILILVVKIWMKLCPKVKSTIISQNIVLLRKDKLYFGMPDRHTKTKINYFKNSLSGSNFSLTIRPRAWITIFQTVFEGTIVTKDVPRENSWIPWENKLGNNALYFLWEVIIHSSKLTSLKIFQEKVV